MLPEFEGNDCYAMEVGLRVTVGAVLQILLCRGQWGNRGYGCALLAGRFQNAGLERDRRENLRGGGRYAK